MGQQRKFCTRRGVFSAEFRTHARLTPLMVASGTQALLSLYGRQRGTEKRMNNCSESAQLRRAEENHCISVRRIHVAGSIQTVAAPLPSTKVKYQVRSMLAHDKEFCLIRQCGKDFLLSSRVLFTDDAGFTKDISTIGIFGVTHTQTLQYNPDISSSPQRFASQTQWRRLSIL
jgi:hypothetical protein